jgi:hypothetical protein
MSHAVRLRVCLLLLLGVAFHIPRGRAAELDGLNKSLQEIPADAAFYVVFLRNREKVDAVTHSKAWKKFKSLPLFEAAWKEALTKGKASTKGGVDQIEQIFQDPEIRPLVDLLIDLVSDEVFVYGGGNVADVVDLYGRIWGRVISEGFRQGMEESITGNKERKQHKLSEEDISRLMLDELAKNRNAVRVPDLVLGFHTTKPDEAHAQLRKLEKLIRPQLNQIPDLKDLLQWKKVGDNDFLTLTVDSKLMKFSEQSLRKYEKKPGQYDALVERIKELRVTVCIGVRGQYVLLAIGESTDPVAKLGQGKRLIDQPELKPLARFADRRLTAISYFSKAIRSRTSVSFFDVGKWIEAGLATLPKSKLPSEVQSRIKKDLSELSKELEKPPAGAALGFAFLTDRGLESFDYDWTSQASLDGSRPLAILEHLGGTPLVAMAGRSKYSPETWPRFVHWVQVSHGYFEDFAVGQMKPKEREEYQEFIKTARPYLARFDTATGKMFLPSLADGEWAFVLDAKLSSKQWTSLQPPSEREIRILEPAVVRGVSDPDLLQNAMGEYRSLINDLQMAAVKKVKTAPVPPLQIPPPESRKVEVGTIFFYPLPAAWGVDARILPNAALSEKIAALSLSQDHSERLLKATPLLLAGRPLTDTNRPLAGATLVDVAGLIDLLTHWSSAAAQFTPAINENAEEARKQFGTLVELLKVLRSYSSRTYEEAGAWVTHSEWGIADLN